VTDDLSAFLTARLDEDERYARVMQAAGRRLKDSAPAGMEAFAVSALAAVMRDPDAMREVARWEDRKPPNDLGRVLREIAAKRAILAEHSPHYPVTYPQPSGQPTCTVCDEGGFDPDPAAWPCPTVRHLAAVWSGHPDWRPEWSPSPEAAPL
jgi:hypothetical protein